MPEWLSDLAYRVRRLVNRRAAEDEMAGEMASHIEFETERLVREGVSPDDARRRAIIAFGGVAQVKESARDAWGTHSVDVLRRDIGHALRLATRQPVFSSVVVLSLALGLAATMTVVNLAYNVLWAPLDLPRPNEIVSLTRWTSDGRDVVFRWQEIESLRAAPGAAVTAWRGASAVAFRIGEHRESVNLDFVAGNYFRVLEARAKAGRLITEQDDATAAPVVVVSPLFAGQLFPGDSQVVGRVVDIRGTAFTIIGVTDDSFGGVKYPAIFTAAIPLGSVSLLGVNGVGRDNRGQPYGRGDDRLTELRLFQAVGRMDPGVPSAQAALRSSFARCCAGAGPDSAWLQVVDASRGVPGGKGDIRQDVRGTLTMVLGGVALLLVVVCCNVAGLLLVRSSARTREMAVRLSLGASRRRLVWQLVAEAIPSGLVAGAAGLLLAAWFTSGFSATLPSDWVDIAPMFDFRARPLILAVAAVLTGFCTIGFSVYPALRATGLAPAATLRVDSRASRTRGQGAVARGVVITQVALTVVLVVSAALLSATLGNIARFDVGLAADRTLLVSLETRSTPYEASGFLPVADDVSRAVESVPGVRASTLATLVPLHGGSNYETALSISGLTPRPGDEVTARLVIARAGYFATSGLRITSGREFTAGGPAAGEVDVVVNEAFVRRYFPDRNPVGQQIGVAMSNDIDRMIPAVIVGVSANAVYVSPKEDAQPYVYAPLHRTNAMWRSIALVVRTSGPPMAVAPAVLSAIERATPGMTARRVRDAETQIAYSTTAERLTSRLAVFVSALTLALAAIGLYGIVAYGVSRRVSEIGVRLALGARPASIVWLVTRETAWMVIGGIALGVGLSYGATGAMRSQFYGVDAHSPLAWLGAALVLILTALAASALPAGRATRVDPRVALQAD
jgi:predicted permease